MVRYAEHYRVLLLANRWTVEDPDADLLRARGDILGRPARFRLRYVNQSAYEVTIAIGTPPSG